MALLLNGYDKSNEDTCLINGFESISWKLYEYLTLDLLSKKAGDGNLDEVLFSFNLVLQALSIAVYHLNLFCKY